MEGSGSGLLGIKGTIEISDDVGSGSIIVRGSGDGRSEVGEGNDDDDGWDWGGGSGRG